jgi:hypothetical protein
MDPRLFDILWEVYREAGSREPIHVISAYRSPATNSMLRNRSRAVSEQSQHMSGKAMDIRLPDVDTGRLRAVAMQMQYGGVGYYPSSGFVHVDTGSVRAWPRMQRDQLARLFPNGKTAHLPSNGPPLPGYEEARAEIQTRNAQLASAGSSSVGNLIASLFAGSRERPSADLPANASAFAPSGSATPIAAIPPPRPTGHLPDYGQSASELAQPGRGPSEGAPRSFPVDEQAAIRALFSTAPSDVALHPRARLTIARVQSRPIPMGSMLGNPSPLLERGFASGPIEGLSVTHFTGPAVKPLPNMRYTMAAL